MTTSLKPITIAVVSVKTKIGDGLRETVSRGFSYIADRGHQDWLHDQIELCAENPQKVDPGQTPKIRPVNLRILSNAQEEDSGWLLRAGREALAMTGYASSPLTVEFVSSDEELRGVNYFFVMGDVPEPAERLSDTTPLFTRVKFADVRVYDDDDDENGKGIMVFV